MGKTDVLPPGNLWLRTEPVGKEITQDLYAITRREREEGVQPVLKEDVAEVLRRRFFTPESIKDRESFREQSRP